MQQGDTAAAMQYSNQMDARQMQADNALTQAWASGISNTIGAGVNAYAGGMSAGGGGGGTAPGGVPLEDWGGDTYDPNVDYSNVSDRKLKKNVKKISKSPSGLNIYSFEFKDSKYGKGLFQGVMSDEVPREAVTKKDGYDMVDYSKLDVEFKQI